MLATFTVNSLTDTVNFSLSDSEVCLREAVFRAEQDDTHDIIDFDPAVFDEPTTITLTQGELSITESVTIDGTIDGAGPSNVSLGITIDAGNGTDQMPNTGDGITILSISSGDVEIDSLTLTGGDTGIPYLGGAITGRDANLTVRNSVITGNASPKGGGIQFESQFEAHQLKLYSTTVSNNNASYGGGGGLYIKAPSSSATIESSMITGNQAEGQEEQAGQGGGIKANVHSFNLQSSTVENNRSTHSGGGLFITAVGEATVTINESTIDLNESTGGYSLGGGLVINSSNSSVTITDTTISNNKALGSEANTGGMDIQAKDDSVVLIDGVAVTDNHADDDVGGMAIVNSASEVTVQNSTISGNTASFTQSGSYDVAGGVYLATTNGGTITVKNSTIWDNSTTANCARPEGKCLGAGLRVGSAADTNIAIENSTISGNRSQRSGGGIKIGQMFHQGGNVYIRHSTITNNRADSDNSGTGTGGGIHVGDSHYYCHTGPHNRRQELSRHGQYADDIDGPITLATVTWSLIGDKTGTSLPESPPSTADANGNRIGGPTNGAIDPKLGPLVYNGGPMFLDGSRMLTHAVLPTSPAVNAGDPTAMAGVGDIPEFDQRGDSVVASGWTRESTSARFERQSNPLPRRLQLQRRRRPRPTTRCGEIPWVRRPICGPMATAMV